MTYVTDAAAKPRLLSLDLARGLAALIVALYHFSEFGWLKLPNATPPMAVPFFFMLSGYVLSYSYGDLIASGRMGVGDFIRARIARLYPLHIATLLAVVVLWLLLGTSPPPSPPPGYPLEARLFSRLQLFEALSFTHALFGGANGFNGPSWSISIEFWCAFVVFLLLRPLTPMAKAAIILGVLAAVAATAGRRWQLIPWPPRAYTVGAGLFLVGWALHLATLRLRPLACAAPPWTLWLTAAVIFLAIVVPGWDVAGRQLAFYAAFAVLIAVLAQVEPASAAGRALMSRAGDWSYGIYLWHFPIICLLVWADGHVRARLGASLLGTVAGDILFVALVVSTSAWCYRAFERPAKALLRSRPRMRQQG